MSPAPMPLEVSQAIVAALDEQRERARLVRRFERKVALSKHRKQKMMALLRVAAAGKGRVLDWLEQLGLDGGARSLPEALSAAFERLPIDDAAHAPPGAVVLGQGTTAAVKGFGARLYGADLGGRVLGVFAPT